MTNSISTTCVASILTLIGASAVPGAAQAEPVSGLYIGAGAGVNIMQQEPITALGKTNTGSLNMQFGVGAVGVGSIGYGWGNGFRTEFQLNYRYNGIQSFSGPRGNTVNIPNSASGKEQKYGPMPTLYYDFNGVSPAVVPYVGLGVGFQIVNENFSGAGFSGNRSEGAFAGQAIVGAAFPIQSVPGLSLTTEYRFFAVSGDRKYDVGTSSVTLGNDFNHSILIGLRYEFHPAPPPVVPMPVADMGAKTFLVFFDWDRADLTARGAGIVHEAAAYSTHTQYTRLDVDGNTDTSGTPAYNQGLSERRARVVATELVRDGVPQNAISMHAYGDTKLLVPTGPNTREPQNRRVEIVFH
jgi:OOP family OmpA-OmpF porin